MELMFDFCPLLCVRMRSLCGAGLKWVVEWGMLGEQLLMG